MTLLLITAPATEPITATEAKLQAKIEHSVDDDLLTILISSARKAAEHLTGRAFITQTWERVLDEFPSSSKRGVGGAIELGKPTVLSVVSVKYIDVDGVEQTMAPSAYRLDSVCLPGWVVPAIDTDWPDTQAEAINAVRVRFTCGYGNAAAVPANVKQWMLLQIATAYRNREAFSTGISVADLPNRWVDGLLDSERTFL